MRLATTCTIALAAGLSLLAAGCGERPKVTVYKQGQYQGKPDTRPWDNDPPKDPSTVAWQKGDKASWEKSIKARNLGQNEYVRIEGASNK